MDQVKIEMPWDSLLASGGGKAATAYLFVAYRFNDADSLLLRSAIHDAAKIEPGLSDADGHVKEGDSWADEVRKRLKKSRLVVADLTGPSREVLFEVGFAGNKAVFPLCHREIDLEAMPPYLTMKQVSTFEGERLPVVVDRIIDRALGPIAQVRRPPPVPGRIVWIQGRDSAWADETRHKIEALALQASVPLTRVDPDDLYAFEDLEAYMRCWLFVGVIDGSRADLASHLFFGDLAARTKAGAGRGKGEYLVRHAVAFAENRDLAEEFLADSARRLNKQLLTIAVGGKSAVSTVNKHLKRYKAWRAPEK